MGVQFWKNECMSSWTLSLSQSLSFTCFRWCFRLQLVWSHRAWRRDEGHCGKPKERKPDLEQPENIQKGWSVSYCIVSKSLCGIPVFFSYRDSSRFESVMDMSGMTDSSQLSIETQTEETVALMSHGFEVVRCCQVMSGHVTWNGKLSSNTYIYKKICFLIFEYFDTSHFSGLVKYCKFSQTTCYSYMMNIELCCDIHIRSRHMQACKAPPHRSTPSSGWNDRSLCPTWFLSIQDKLLTFCKFYYLYHYNFEPQHP